jgi:predicted PurR-regulated permease PerM
MKLNWKTLVKIGISVFLLYLCIYYWPAVSTLLAGIVGAAAPLLIGCVIAYPVNILMTTYEKIYFPKTQRQWLKSSRRPACLTLAYLTLATIVALVMVLILPQLISCIATLVSGIPDLMRNVIALLEEKELLPDDVLGTLKTIDWSERLSGMWKTIANGVLGALDMLINTLSSVFSGIVTALLSVIFSIYLLLGKETLARQIKRCMNRYLNPTHNRRLMHFFHVANDSFHRYIIGQCTEAVILGVLCALGMWILQLPYAGMIGALVAFTALIPVAGAYIGAGVGAVMILTVSPVKALIFLVFIIVLQQLEGNLVYPKVVGTSIGLPAIWVLAAVVLGGGVLGIPGMLLGVPLAATAYKLLREDLNRTDTEQTTPVEAVETPPNTMEASKPTSTQKNKNQGKTSKTTVKKVKKKK